MTDVRAKLRSASRKLKMAEELSGSCALRTDERSNGNKISFFI
jgi:hypothetical protein